MLSLPDSFEQPTIAQMTIVITKPSVSIQQLQQNTLPHDQQHGSRGCEGYVIDRYHGYENAL